MNYYTAILTGGKSSRMGKDKALVLFRGKSLLQHAIDLFSSFSNEICVSANKEYNTYLPIVKDRHKEIGPMGGIHALLTSCHADHVVVIPVDTPLISKEIIQELLDNHTTQQASVCRTKDGLQMLVGIYSKTILPILEKQIQNKDYKLSNLLDIANIQVLDMEKYATKFSNINTLNDLIQISENKPIEE